MKNYILSLLILFLFFGCNGTQPTSQNNTIEKSEKIKQQEEYERTISYQDIIMKINDINTNKKTNKRVKNIVKEYRYNVSDDDSKNSARKKALNQVKILILEEIGVFVESYLELNKVVENEKYQKYFKEEIKNLTAGIIKTKIIDEKFDGKTYYVKASVLVDPDSVSEGISEILKIKANKNEINRLSQLLKSKEKEVDMRSSETIALQKKMANQELLNNAKQEELKSIQLKLRYAQEKLLTYTRSALKVKNDYEKAQKEIQKAVKRIEKQNKKACLIKKGMNKNEVYLAIGEPDTYIYKTIYWDKYDNSVSTWYYGTVSIYFNSFNHLVEKKHGCSW